MEVQVQSQSFYENRTFFYAAKSYVDPMNVGDGYGELVGTYSLSFCDFNLFDHQDVHSRFSVYDKAHDVELKNLIELHYFELRKLKGALDKRSYKWLHLLKYGSRYDLSNLPEELATEEAIRMALEARNLALSDEQQRLLILSREKFERDQITMVDAAENKGRHEGRIEGRNEGRIEGVVEGQRHIIAHMLAKGMDEASIQELTGLPLEEIRGFRLGSS